MCFQIVNDFIAEICQTFFDKDLACSLTFDSQIDQIHSSDAFKKSLETRAYLEYMVNLTGNVFYYYMFF